MPAVTTDSATDSQPKSSSRRRWLGLFLLCLLIILSLSWRTLAGRVAVNRAWAAIHDWRLQDAREWLDRGQAWTPRSPDVALGNARLARHLSDTPAMSKHLDRAQRLGATPDAVDRERTFALAEAGQLEQAETDITAMLIDQRGDGAEISAAYANGLLHASRLSEAQVLLEMWQTAFPEDPRVYYLQARLDWHQIREHPAMENLRTAIAKNPNYAPAQYLLGRLLFAQNQTDESVPHFRRAAESVKANTAPLIGIAKCLRTQGDFDAARRILEELTTRPPEEVRRSLRFFGDVGESTSAAYELGTLESSAGNFEVAFKWLDRDLSDHPGNLSIRQARAEALRGMGRTEEARSEFADIAEAQREMKEADQLIATIKESDPRIEDRFRVGSLSLKHGLTSSGEFWLRSVLRFAPQHKKTHQLLADHFDQRSQTEPRYRSLADWHRSEAGP